MGMRLGMCPDFSEKNCLSAIRLVYLSTLLVSLSFCYVSAAWADEDTQVSKESSKPAEPQAPERHRFSLVFAPVRLGFGAAWYRSY